MKVGFSGFAQKQAWHRHPLVRHCPGLSPQDGLHLHAFQVVMSVGCAR